MTKRPLTRMEDETPEFVEFWEAWRPNKRRNDGRGDARDTYYQHVRAGVDPQDITDGAKWYLANLSGRDKEYIPLAATWINRRDYEDGAEMYRRLQEQLKERKRKPANDPAPPKRKTAFLEAWERGGHGEFKKKEA